MPEFDSQVPSQEIPGMPSPDAAALPFSDSELAQPSPEPGESAGLQEAAATLEQDEAVPGVETDFITSLEDAFEKANQVGEARVAESEARLKEATELSAARQELLDRDNELYEKAKAEAQEFIIQLEKFSQQVRDTGLPPMRIAKLLVSIHAAIELRKIELDNIEKNHAACRREVSNSLPNNVKITRRESAAQKGAERMRQITEKADEDRSNSLAAMQDAREAALG